MILQKNQAQPKRKISWPIRVIGWLCEGFFLLIAFFNFLLWGRFGPISRVDELKNPATVVAWDENGLKLSDGRVVMPAGMAYLPKESETIRIVSKHGVEVAPDGKVFGLVKIWHWCGNDPVRNDLSKLELAKLLAFYQEGESRLKPYQYAEHSFVEEGGGKEHGWSISSAVRMRMSFDPKYAQMFAPVEAGASRR